MPAARPCDSSSKKDAATADPLRSWVQVTRPYLVPLVGGGWPEPRAGTPDPTLKRKALIVRLPRLPDPIAKGDCYRGRKVRFRCGQPYGFPSTYKVQEVSGDNVLLAGCGWFDIALLAA